MESSYNGLESSKALPFGGIIKDRKFRIPVYQRNYKWGMDMALKLAQDLYASYKKGDTKSIGLLTLYWSEKENYFDIIDGQQRFITLSILFSLLEDGGETVINLVFERDSGSRKRVCAIWEEYEKCWEKGSTDGDRIRRNKEKIKTECIDKIEGVRGEKGLFKEYILEKCMMLCTIVRRSPENEFMNLNAYKTRFSVCDYVRANLISLNSFYQDKLTEKSSIIAPYLDKHSYKTAIAHLYDDILDIFYMESLESKTSSNVRDGEKYKNVYDVVGSRYADPKRNKESRINILFSGIFKNMLPNLSSGEYFSEEINQNVDEWIQLLLKTSCAKKLLEQLKDEMGGGNFSSAKAIDDYQKLKHNNFLDLIMNLNVGEENIDTITLAKLLQENVRVGHVLMKELNPTDLKLANRYFEAFVYSNLNEVTVTAAEAESDKLKLPQMEEKEIISCIQGAGQYVIDRFVQEQKREIAADIMIAPVLDLADRENVDFGGKIVLEGGSAEDGNRKTGDMISVGRLFEHKIKIPVIQRDYCMGARIGEKKAEKSGSSLPQAAGESTDDFLEYLIDNFIRSREEEIVASTILIAVENKTGDIYIFDGQQRTYTLYHILKRIEQKESDCTDESFRFIGRKHGLSRYSEQAVKNLQNEFEIRTRKKNLDLNQFGEFLRNKVKYKVKVMDTISDAEQFFMDINGGVSLQKYEIFKSCLCKKLKELEKDDFIKKMENEWLDWFYRFRHTGKLESKAGIESDVEEVIEMRMIEFLCRFFISERLKEKNPQAPSLNSADVFDCIETKSELVGRLAYLKEKKTEPEDTGRVWLETEDVNKIEEVMDYLVQQEEKIRQSEQMPIESECKEVEEDSKGSKLWIGYNLLKQEEKWDCFIEKYRNSILYGFITSMGDEKRENMRRFYSWKDLESLIKIYDGDLLIADCIWSILGKKKERGEAYRYPYGKTEEISLRILCGYQQGGEEPIPLCQKLPETEIPVYYVRKFIYYRNYARLKYVHDKKPEVWNFILSKKARTRIEREDGRLMPIAVPKDSVWKNKITRDRMNPAWEGGDGWYFDMGSGGCAWLVNRTDAYCLNSVGVLSGLLPTS